MEDRQDQPTPGPRTRHPKEQCDRGAQREERGRHHRQQKVLDHVHAEEVLGVDVDGRRERDEHGAKAGQPGSHPPGGDRNARPRPVHPPDGGQVGARGDERCEPRKGIERPLSEDATEGRLDCHGSAGHGGRRDRHDEDAGGEAAYDVTEGAHQPHGTAPWYHRRRPAGSAAGTQAALV